jgi:hypothetical protein
MTDMQASKRPVTVPGNNDLGLGYCYRCIQYLTIQDVSGKATRYVPKFAVTVAPFPLGPTILALPACYDCLTGRGEAGQPGSGLIAANGRLPG